MANYTAVAAGGDWNVSTTWSPAGVPGALDTAILNSASGNVTVPAAGSTCATLTINGYLGTLLLNGNLTIATSGLNLGSFTGTINFNAGDIILPDGLFNLGNASVYTTLGTGGVRITKPSASFSIFNTNNKIWNCKFALAATGSTSPTIYFEDNPLEVTGLVSFQATTTGTINLISADIFTPNLVFLKMSGDFTISGSTIYTTSTSGQNIGFTGSANQTLTASGTHQLRSPLIVNKTGGVLTLSGTLNYNTGTFTYTAGTVNSGTSTLNIGATTTFNTNGSTVSGATATSSTGINWYNVTLSSTLNLTSNFTSVGTFTANAGAITRAASENLYLGGNLTMSSTLTSTAATVIMNGSGTWSGAGAVTAPLTINTAGTITISGSVTFSTRTLTYITASSVVTTGSTLNIGTSCTLDTNIMNWNNIVIAWGGGSPSAVSITVTLSSNLSLLGNLTLNGNAFPANMTFAGSGNISCSGNLAINQLYNGGSVTLSLTLTNTLNATNLTTSAPNTIQYFTLNGGTMNLSGGITLGNVYAGIIGTTNINLIGTGTINCGSGVSISVIRNNLTINTLGTITLGGTLLYNTGTLTYIQGTMVYNSNILNIANSYNQTGAISCSLSGNANWFSLNIAPSTSATVTLLSNINTQNLVASSVAINGLFNLSVNNNITINGGTSGTSTILINGTGNQSWTHGSAVYLSNNLTINKASGTLTIGANVYYATGTLNYIASGGTVDVTTNSSTLNIGGNTTLNTNGISWYNFRNNAAAVLTLNSDFTWTNDWTIPTSYIVSFAVSAGNLTPTSTANINFTAAQVTLKNDITVNNVTRNGGKLDNNKINITGNLSVVTTNTTVGTTTFEINGTGNQTYTSTAFLNNPTIINKLSGTLILGSTTYHGANFTYTQGNIDFTTNNNVFYVINGTYNVTGISFNTFYFATGGAGITLGSDLYATTFTVGLNGSITGTFNVYCSYFNMNNLSSGQTSTTLTYSGIIYCSNDATFSSSTNSCRITGDLYVGGSCYHNAPASAGQGAANLYMVGNGELRAPSTAGTFVSNLYFNTSGKITITGNLSYALGASRTINLIKGNVDARKATLTLNRAFTHTLTNMNKMVWGNVILDTISFITLNMNEFFCGDATTQTNITTNNAAINATVTFTDNFEKIAKFVNINGITFTRPQQLLLITNQPKKSRNRGIRYNNDLPNGIPKGDPSVQNTQTVGQSRTLLLGDPAFVKSI